MFLCPVFGNDEVLESRDIHDLLEFMNVVVFIEEDDGADAIGE